MSNGYYIYLDRRDVGKGDMWFLGWVNDIHQHNVIPTIGINVPVFSPRNNRAVFPDKAVADKTAEMIVNMYPEIKGLLHVEPCEEIADMAPRDEGRLQHVKSLKEIADMAPRYEGRLQRVKPFKEATFDE